MPILGAHPSGAGHAAPLLHCRPTPSLLRDGTSQFILDIPSRTPTDRMPSRGRDMGRRTATQPLRRLARWPTCRLGGDLVRSIVFLIGFKSLWRRRAYVFAPVAGIPTFRAMADEKRRAVWEPKSKPTDFPASAVNFDFLSLLVSAPIRHLSAQIPHVE